jgi:hypothetical protein
MNTFLKFGVPTTFGSLSNIGAAMENLAHPWLQIQASRSHSSAHALASHNA